jgi:hypothetical protein
MSIRREINTLSIALAASAMLASSCTNQVTEDQENDANIETRIIKERKELNLVRNDLIAVEQGCEGRIVVGLELRNLVVGKHHAYKIPGVVSKYGKNDGLKKFNYHTDGTLFYSNSPPYTFSRFELYETQFCHKTQLPTCFRLIEDVDGVIFSEYITYGYIEKSLPKKAKLQCVALEIKDLENDE